MAEKRVVYLTFSTVGGKSTLVLLVLELLYKMLKQRLMR